jgi:hypothetical protein
MIVKTVPAPENIAKDFSDALVGLSCTKVERPSDWSWQIVFGEGKVIFGIETPWRILVNGSIRFGDEDHAQLFGLPEPLDGPKRCLDILGTSHVVTAVLSPGTSDLTIAFDNGVQLEIFNHSCGYEGWSCSFSGKEIIALGGGGLATTERA